MLCPLASGSGWAPRRHRGHPASPASEATPVELEALALRLSAWHQRGLQECAAARDGSEREGPF